MKVLLTGASSFTGYWFATTLVTGGHHVVAPMRAARDAYASGPRAERVRRLSAACEVIWDCPFGGDRFLDLVDGTGFDVLCHHAAQVGDYRNPDFDIAAALQANTRALPDVLRRLMAGGLKGIVHTGSVFEQDEGAGSLPLRAFSPYGLSKGLTADVIAYWCEVLGLRRGKFTIPNPFGPLEEPRFCAYLIKCWRAGEAADVRTPSYVRDNIHVDLLAAAYAQYVEAVASEGAVGPRCNPSGYVETQGAFAQRFAAEVAARSALACRVTLAVQTDFAEPLVRINLEPASHQQPDWREADAWETIVAYYLH